MKPSITVKIATVKLVSVATLIAFMLACGYSPKMTAASAGTMPSISELSPDSVNAGSAAFTLVVHGSNFNTNAVVNWNGAAQTGTTFDSAGELKLAIPVSAVASAGMIQVTVTNPGTPGMGIYGTGATLPETSNMMTLTVN
jgi:IPT/TIG domain